MLEPDFRPAREENNRGHERSIPYPDSDPGDRKEYLHGTRPSEGLLLPADLWTDRNRQLGIPCQVLVPGGVPDAQGCLARSHVRLPESAGHPGYGYSAASGFRRPHDFHYPLQAGTTLRVPPG